MTRGQSKFKFPIAPILRDLGADHVPTGKRWLKMKCPFHEDRTASASVNNETQYFKCHSCGVAGDAIDLLVEVEGLAFHSAVARAEELCGTRDSPVSGKRGSGRSVSGSSRSDGDFDLLF